MSASMPAPNSPVLKAYRKVGNTAPGRWMLSKAVCLKAPYFTTIQPVLTHLEPGRLEADMTKRWLVTNHLGTVHAIAMCNLAEFVGGLCMEVSLRSDMRWIPVGMEVRYQAMAKTDLHAVCTLDPSSFLEPGDVVAPVSVTDTAGKEVFHADIKMRISWKKKK